MPKLPPDTPEQTKVTAYTGRCLVVKAYAGTGKTTVLVKYALRNPKARILYLAYNRAIRDEAKAKFPRNVHCMTAHQLAYAAVGKRYAHKLTTNLRLTEVAQAIGSRNWTLAKDVLDTFNAFLHSTDPRLLTAHFKRGNTGRALTGTQQRYLHAVLEGAERLWRRMTDEHDPFRTTHDTYLKQFQLLAPDLSHYDTILFDEAQDANPLISSLVLQHRGRVILVGDSHQQIYRWRGADNALDASELRHADQLYLTHSFRFGPNVALVANAILELKGESRPVVGRGAPDRVVLQLPRHLPHRVVLHRTVMGVLQTALRAADSGIPLYWVGGINGYQVNELVDLYWLSRNRREKLRKKQFAQEYSCFSEYQDIAKATRDPEMCRAVAIIEQYDDLPERLAVLRQQTVESESDAALTVSTVHRSKGLEWEHVALANDFPDVFDSNLSEQAYADELNLLYVAATRAQHTLALNDALSTVIRYVTEKRRRNANRPAAPHSESGLTEQSAP